MALNASLVAPSQRVLCLSLFTSGDHSSRSACYQGQPVISCQERSRAVQLWSMNDSFDHSSDAGQTVFTGSCWQIVMMLCHCLACH